MLRQNNAPDAVNMRIIEAPAEFALPVKQDRRLLPCFKVRLEVQHRGTVSLPVTLRAHVLSQQDKEQIATWVPPDDAASRDDKGQKAATELKGTAFIRCTLEAGSSGEIRPVGMGGKDGQSLPQSTNGGSTAFAFSAAVRGAERAVKPEPSYGFPGAAAAGTAATGLGPASAAGGSRVVPGLSGPGLPHDQQTVEPPPYGLQEPSSSLGANGMLRDVAMPGLHGPARDVSLNSLFAANRPDPVVTLASSGRMSGTGSSLSGLGGPGLGGTGGGGLSGLRLNPGDPRDSFDAAVEMIMQSSQQQHQQQQPRRAWQVQGMVEPGVGVGSVGVGGGSLLLNDMQRQLQQRQEEQGQRQQQQPQRQDRPSSISSGGGGAALQGGKLITATQDFEFTNLEFLKPTRMNKVYMAFTASVHDTDLLFVVFNVPTIGICRAEQREKACKKLHVDYRLLSHFDQALGGDRMQDAAAAGFPPGRGGGGAGPPLEPNPGGRLAAQGKGVKGSAEQEQQQQSQQPQQHTGPLSPSLSLVPGGGGGSAAAAKFVGQRQDSGRLQAQLSDTDFPRMPSGLDLQQQQQQLQRHHHQQQQQQQQMLLQHHHLQQQQQQQQQEQQRMAEACGTPPLQAGGGSGTLVGGSLLGCGAGAMPGGALSDVLPSGGLSPNAGLGLSGLSCGGMGGPGPGGMAGPPGGVGVRMGFRMLHGGMATFVGMGGNGLGCDLGASGPDFFFGGGGMAGGMAGAGPMATGPMGGGLSLSGGVGGVGCTPVGHHEGLGVGVGSSLGINGGGGGQSRKRDQGPKEDDNCRFQPVQQPPQELPAYQGFMGLTSSDVEMLLPAPHSRMAMREFINEVYDSTGLNRKLTHMDLQALLSQAGFPMDSTREHDTISPQQWDEFCSQFRSIVNTLQQVASVWNLEDPVVISGFDMDRAGTITALANEPAGTFICRFSMSQPGCLVLTCKVSTVHPRADAMGLIHAIIKIDDLHERRVDTWIRDYAGATHLLDVYRQKRVDKRKVFATNYTRLRGLEVGGEQLPLGMGPPGYM
ncbi:hypothetical protein PLESTM_001565000 [Pleodorina starrii]|nr:hypothetical protein PLESTM_001565000 [Pleodorina starrii]